MFVCSHGPRLPWSRFRSQLPRTRTREISTLVRTGAVRDMEHGPRWPAESLSSYIVGVWIYKTKLSTVIFVTVLAELGRKGSMWTVKLPPDVTAQSQSVQTTTNWFLNIHQQSDLARHCYFVPGITWYHYWVSAPDNHLDVGWWKKELFLTNSVNFLRYVSPDPGLGNKIHQMSRCDTWGWQGTWTQWKWWGQGTEGTKIKKI